MNTLIAVMQITERFTAKHYSRAVEFIIFIYEEILNTRSKVQFVIFIDIDPVPTF